MVYFGLPVLHLLLNVVISLHDARHQENALCQYVCCIWHVHSRALVKYLLYSDNNPSLKRNTDLTGKKCCKTPQWAWLWRTTGRAGSAVSWLGGFMVARGRPPRQTRECEPRPDSCCWLNGLVSRPGSLPQSPRQLKLSKATKLATRLEGGGRWRCWHSH